MMKKTKSFCSCLWSKSNKKISYGKIKEITIGDFTILNSLQFLNLFLLKTRTAFPQKRLPRQY